MDKYVVSRELAEKLKAAGYPQNARFAWIPEEQADEVTYFADNDGYLLVMENGLINYYNDHGESLIAAPLSDELLEQLPKSLRKEVGTTQLKFRYYYLDVTASHSTGGWLAGYRIPAAKLYERNWFKSKSTYMAGKPADALAQLWLWCEEQGVPGGQQ